MIKDFAISKIALWAHRTRPTIYTYLQCYTDKEYKKIPGDILKFFDFLETTDDEVAAESEAAKIFGYSEMYEKEEVIFNNIRKFANVIDLDRINKYVVSNIRAYDLKESLITYLYKNIEFASLVNLKNVS